MPGREALPPDATENCKLDLVSVERMEEFKGFVFVCFDKNAVALSDYLAGAGEYLAYVSDQGANGMEIVTGTQDYCVAANWKLLQENSADGYHGVPTHSTYFDYLVQAGHFRSRLWRLSAVALAVAAAVVTFARHDAIGKTPKTMTAIAGQIESVPTASSKSQAKDDFEVRRAYVSGRIDSSTSCGSLTRRPGRGNAAVTPRGGARWPRGPI